MIYQIPEVNVLKYFFRVMLTACKTGVITFVRQQLAAGLQ